MADTHAATPPTDTSVARLGRDTLIYGLGFVLQRAASFIMLPIYTRYLDPTQYGMLQLLQMTLDVATIVLAAGITAAVQRYYFKTDDPRERKGVIIAAWVMLIGFNILGALLIWGTSPLIATHVLKDPAAVGLVLIVASSFAIDPCITISTLYMQVQQKATLYTLTSLARLGLQLSLNVFFVVVLERGVEGILISTLITYVVLSPVLLRWMFRQTGWVIIKDVFKRIFMFGLPYRVTDAGSFILTYVDRYVLMATHGLFVTGVYSLAYQFGFMLGYLGAVPFFMAWNPQRFQIVDHPRAERDAAYNRSFKYLSVVMLSLTVGISLFVTPVLYVMSDPAYHGAAQLVPLVLAAYVCQSWTKVMEFGIQVSERTSYTTYATWIAVAVIVALYALLIPPFGAMGAAIATLIAFIVRLIAFAIFAERVHPIDYHWGAHLQLTAYAILVIGTVFVIMPPDFWFQVVIATVGSAAFGLLVWRGGILDDEERQVLIDGAYRYGRLIQNTLRRD